MSGERVSVIIPTFRRPGAVVEAIASALAQSVPVHEVIVIDDASGDGTADAVREIPDPRVRLIALPENGGQSAATNIGMDAATGDIVALLDSDDLWLPDKTAAQLAVWRAHPRRDETLFSALVQVEVDGVIESVRPERPIRESDAMDHYLFMLNGLVQSSTFFLSRGLATAVRFDETMRRHSDLTFLLRLAHRGGTVCQLTQPLVRWRSTSSGTRLSTTAKLDSSMAWFQKYRALMSARGAIAFRYRNHIRILRRHDKPAAVVLTLRALAAGVIGLHDVRRRYAAWQTDRARRAR